MASYTAVWLNGQRLTAWMLYVIMLLDADLFRAFGVHVIVTSAIRTYAEQEAIFRARYVTAGNVNGRRVYDTRWWNGQLWYRISSAGTVAQPGTSNHEIQGSRAAVDIQDTGRDSGITVASSARGRWIRQWCRSKGLLIASGDGFGEGWHFDVPGIFRTPPKAATTKEDDMIINIKGKAGVRRGGLYYVSNGKATFIGSRSSKRPGGFPMFVSETEIGRLQAKIKGLR